jgi:hypothetical protein
MRLRRVALQSAVSSAGRAKGITGHSLLPVEFEAPRQPTTVGAQLVQKSFSGRLPRNAELMRAGEMNLNFVALFER